LMCMCSSIIQYSIGIKTTCSIPFED